MIAYMKAIPNISFLKNLQKNVFDDVQASLPTATAADFAPIATL